MRQVEEPSHVVVFTDSDHAGCLKTGKSTSSSKLFYGSHFPRSTSTTQGVIALSLGESLIVHKKIKNDDHNKFLSAGAEERRQGLALRVGVGPWLGTGLPSWSGVGLSFLGWWLALHFRVEIGPPFQSGVGLPSRCPSQALFTFF